MMRSVTTESNPTPDLTFVTKHLFTAILWVDEGLNIKWANAQAEQLLAISRTRLLSLSILALLAPQEHFIKQSQGDAIVDDFKHKNNDDLGHKNNAKRDISANKPTYSLKARFAQAAQYQQPFINHDRTINPKLSAAGSIDYSVTPVTYEAETYFIVELWGKDRQSRINDEQRQQQQYSVARHMLRSVAHEIKNPLAGVRGAAQLLQRQFIKFSTLTTSASDMPSVSHTSPMQAETPAQPDSRDATNIQAAAQKLKTYTEIIISETDRLTQLISQFLGSNQLPNLQMINIHEPIEHVLTLVLNQYPQVNLQRDYDLSLPELRADKDQLIQVFLNLINNACEAMTESRVPSNSALPDSNSSNEPAEPPQLHIQTRVVSQHTINGQQHRQVLKVMLTDNGCGIAPDMIEQIFFPMVTSRASGTGLGLSIVQDIISRHHGMIDVSSSQDPDHRYTRFTLYLPFD